MAHTLEDVIGMAEKEFGLKVTEENKPKYIGFVQRQLDSWGYDLNYKPPNAPPVNGRVCIFPYLALEVDKLLIFARLIREEPVINKFYEMTFLECDEKLSLLKVESSRDVYADKNLCNLYARRQNNHKRYGLMGPVDIINELGADPEVVSTWGRVLTYKDDVASKKKMYIKH